MPADLDQFGRENSHGTVIGGKGLVELGHMPANTRPFFHQINLEPGSGKVKGGLNAADPSPNNQHISKITLSKTSGYLLNDFFWQYFVFHFLYLFRFFLFIEPISTLKWVLISCSFGNDRFWFRARPELFCNRRHSQSIPRLKKSDNAALCQKMPLPAEH